MRCRPFLLLFALAAFADNRLPEPDWSRLTSSYVTDSVSVGAAIDAVGSVYAVQSVAELPDNIVRALKQWRVDDPRLRGKAVQVTMPSGILSEMAPSACLPPVGAILKN